MNIIIVHLKETDTKTGDSYKAKFLIRGKIEDVPDFVEYVNSIINKAGRKAELHYVETEYVFDSWRDWRKYS